MMMAGRLAAGVMGKRSLLSAGRASRAVHTARRAMVATQAASWPAAAAGTDNTGGSGEPSAADVLEKQALAEYESSVRSELWMMRQQQTDRDFDLPPNPYTSRREYSEVFATHKQLPDEHDEEDVGLYYDLGDISSTFPDGTAGTISEEFETTNKNSLLVRQQAFQLIQLMKHFTSEDASPGFQLPRFKLLLGERGIGKSAALTHIVHHARTAGWVTLFVPSAFNIMNGGYVVTKSAFRKGMVDQHDLAQTMIHHLLTLHAEQLSEAPQLGDYPVDWFLPAELDAAAMAEQKSLREAGLEEERQLRAEAEARGEEFDRSTLSTREAQVTKDLDRASFSLRDMAEWGLRHAPMATDTLLALKEELQRTTAFPVLIAVDGINHLYDESVYPIDGKIVPAEKLSLAHAFRSLSKSGFGAEHGVKNGLVVASSSLTRYHSLDAFTSQVKLTPKMKVQLEKLDRKEVHNTLMHYATCGRFFLMHDPDLVDANEVEYYRMMSDCVPEKLKDVAMYH